MKKFSFMTAKESYLKPSTQIKWKKGYDRQLVEDFIVKTNLRPENHIITDQIVLRKDGWLWVGKYFAFDGASGPTLDTSSIHRAALVHDALYKLHRLGKLPMTMRTESDDELARFIVRDGGYKFRSRLYRWAVSAFGFNSAAIPRKITVIEIKNP